MSDALFVDTHKHIDCSLSIAIPRQRRVLDLRYDPFVEFFDVSAVESGRHEIGIFRTAQSDGIVGIDPGE